LQEHNLPIDCLQAGKDRTTIKEIQTLLGYSATKKKYASFPPILFKDLKSLNDDPGALFLNPSLPRVRYMAFDDYNY
jgi:hypothetical protein